MKVLIVGAGASGITTAISIKRRYPNDDITVVEHLDKPLKKILATGNGRCNFGNSNININRYSNSSFVEPILKEYGFQKQLEFFDSISIKHKMIGELAYPMSESAVSVRNALLNECEKLGITINTSENISDYNVGTTISVTTNLKKYEVDKLVFATGGKSSPNLGSDGSIYALLKKHGYSIKDIQPGLCPIRTSEKTKELDGVRVKGTVSLFKDNKLIHQEDGEILFKDHGLSGIVIMNIASIIARDIHAKYQIKIDQLKEYSKEKLDKYLTEKGKGNYLQAFFHPKMIDFIKRANLDTIKASKELPFTFESLDSFEHSQVSVGGLSINNVDKNLMSTLENNVYFVGEILDVDGPCGGYNLMWAIGSALYLK